MKGVARKTGFRLSAGMYTSMGMRLPGQTSIALLLMGTGSRDSGLMTRAGRMQAGMSWRKGERRKGVLPAPLRGRRKSMHLVLLRERRKSVLPLPLRSQKKQKNAQPTQIRWKKKKELEQKLARSDGPEEKKRLETQLQQTERELQMKDNDSYRRSHAQYS